MTKLIEPARPVILRLPVGQPRTTRLVSSLVRRRTHQIGHVAVGYSRLSVAVAACVGLVLGLYL
jgi:hypothetical protein